MTRDEAIKAMRSGAKAHLKRKDETWYFDHSKGQPMPIACENPLGWARIFDFEHDDGWQLVKRKVKKTIWVCVEPRLRADGTYFVSHGSPDKDGCVSEGSLRYQVVSFEIEVDE